MYVKEANKLKFFQNEKYKFYLKAITVIAYGSVWSY